MQSLEIDESEALPLTQDPEEEEIFEPEEGGSLYRYFRFMLLAGGCVVVAAATAYNQMEWWTSQDSIQDPPFNFSICLDPIHETTLEGLAQHTWEDTKHCNTKCRRNCSCPNPLVPDTNEMLHGGRWTHGFETNLDRVNHATEDLDVIFYGDSITEHWAGVQFGEPSEKYEGNKEVFEQLFTTTGGGLVDGIALGIGGDRCRQLLYRIQNGELPQHVHPKVFWVLIGTNDISTCCSTRGVIASTIAILEEIRRRKPKSTIVVNSLLPRNNLFQNLFWQESTKVNHAMECYTRGKANMEFFNATSIFVATHQDNREIFNSDYFFDFLHPNKEGSLQWGRAIVAKLREILEATNLRSQN